MKYKLGEICTIIKGATGIMKAIPGAYTMITLGEVDKTHHEYQFDANAVIIPLVSSTGHGHASMKRVKYFEGKFALGNILCAVIPKDEAFVLAKYLHIYLHWNREELLVSQMKGMANVSLSMNKIADVTVSIPSIEKQIEIVELEKELIEKELNADLLFADQLFQLENLNHSILQEAVQGKLVKQDTKDEPAGELLKRIKVEKAKSGKKEKHLPPIRSEEIPFEIPINWVWCRLGEICTKITDGTHHSPTNTENGYYKYITAKNIKDDGIDLSNITYVTKDVHREIYARCNPSKGDVLYIKDGATTGIVTINQLEEEFSMLSSVALLKFPNCILSKYIMYAMRSPFFYKATREGMYGVAITRVTLEKINNLIIPLPPFFEQKRIVAEIENQCAKTKQLKEHIVVNQQATEQLLKALLHQAFEMKETKSLFKPNGKVIELKPNAVNWENLAAEPFKKYAAHPVNNIQDTDWEMAIMVACMKNKLGVTYGDVGLQKNVFNTNNLQPVFSKQYGFINSNFGTYSHELKDDLKRNPYLISQKVANKKEVYAINPKYSKEILNKLSAQENKEFVQAINRMLSIYEHPFINKETDKIELYNTVLKVALDKSTTDIVVIYQGMKDWEIKQTGYKTKAEKFTKHDAEKMLKLLIDKKILK